MESVKLSFINVMARGQQIEHATTTFYDKAGTHHTTLLYRAHDTIGLYQTSHLMPSIAILFFLLNKLTSAYNLRKMKHHN